MNFSFLNDPENVCQNTLPPRAYYEPQKTDGTPHINLNGEWQFMYFASHHYLPDRIADIDFSDSETIQVPGHWQLQGSGKPHYTNIQYPFPINPPHTFQDIPVGIYRKFFELKDNFSNNHLILRLDGVDNCYVLLVNQQYVGFSKGSRVAREFDISKFCKSGENEVIVQVFQWSDSSYIEDQDMWWLSGIFRDVTLLIRPKNYLMDFRVHQECSFSTCKAELILSEFLLVGEESIPATIQVFSPMNVCLFNEKICLFSGSQVSYLIENPEWWTAETPNLYQLTIIYEGESITIDVGFREVGIKNSRIVLNGKPILFKGVNYHEFHESYGRAVPLDFVKQELELMKKANFNAIRMAHYPHNPKIYQLCNRMGFYVIDEADLECHGIGATGDINLLSSDPNWEDAYLDRMRTMVIQNKNHPSILIWSVGNESGNGINHHKMIRWCKNYDPSRLVHHEGESRDCVDKESGLYSKDVSQSDINSRMYPTIEELYDVIDNKDIVKPYILCEYGHSMGNGPGSLQEYWELFRADNQIQGGFIWEWKDHGIKLEEAGNNQEDITRYAFGGDFGDYPNDFNFVIDGLVKPNLDLSPSYFDIQKLQEPHYLSIQSNSEVQISSQLKFLILENLELLVQVKYGKATIYEEKKIIPELKPEQILSENILVDMPSIDFERVTHVVIILKSQLFSSVVSFENNLSKYLENFPSSDMDEAVLKVDLIHGIWSLDSKNGSIFVMERSVFWRPPTDNDFISAKSWEEKGLNHILKRVDSYDEFINGDSHIYQINEEYGAPNKTWKIIVRKEIESLSNGMVNVTVKGNCIGDLPDTLPRIGEEFILNSPVSKVNWLGNGPRESYPDCQNGTYFDCFSSNMEDLNFGYIVPQEEGNRSDVYEVELLLSGNRRIRIISKEKFNFKLSPYCIDEITTKNHNYELKKASQQRFYLDYKHHGIGSRSCGPDVLDKYRLKDREFEYRYSIINYGEELIDGEH